MTDNYKILTGKLDKFIKKYYTSLMIKGILISIAAIGVLYILMNFIEYYAYLETIPRTLLFYAFLVFSIAIIYRMVFLPIIKMFKLGKNISYDEVAKLLGKHFGKINDKLINTLQLRKISELSNEDNDLLIASIEQKIKEIKYIDFNLAIDFSVNKKLIKYAIIPVFIVLILLIIVPRVLTEPSNRIINYNTEFEKPEKFQIHILNNKLEAVQQDDFKLDVKVSGVEIPTEISIKYQNNIYRLNKTKNNLFNYTFRNIQSNIKFELFAEDIRTNYFEIVVFPKPIILSFETFLDYPKYTRKIDETIKNNGDIIIPEGTIVDWKFFTKDASNLFFSINNENFNFEKTNSNVIRFSRKIINSSDYSVGIENQYIKSKDTLEYKITTIPDAFPAIFISEIRDTILKKYLYFNGTIRDDYGFDKLNFKYSVIGNNEEIMNSNKSKIVIEKDKNQNRFYYSFALDTMKLNPGDKLIYYFEVWDNDRINGSKSTKSQTMELRIPEIGEIEKKLKEQTKNIQEVLEESLDESIQIKKQTEKLIKEIINKEKLDWKEKEKVEEILEKQNKLKEKISDAIRKLEKKNRTEESFMKIDKKILEKQRKLEELFKKIMTDEIKELFEKIQEKLDEIDKDKIKELLEDIKMSNEDLEKELDRNLELFKQIEFEKMLNDAIDKLNKIKERQEKLAEETNEKKSKKENIKPKQEKIEEEFNQLKEELKELEKKNSELENKHEMPNNETLENEASDEIDKSQEKIGKNKMSKASEHQKNAAMKMGKMADFLMSVKQSMMKEEQGEDINTLREILENLIQVSFEQEDLIKEINKTGIKDPKYVDVIRKQNNITEDVEMIKDSLFALSKRQIKIEHFVNEEIDEIDRNLKKAEDQINKRKINIASKHQQYVMTHINNLALMLAEVLKKMEEEQSMQNSMSGKGNCTKPGKTGNASSMKKLQQQLNKQLKEMQNGKDKKGKKGKGKGNNEKSMSEQFARMAAKQAEIRNRMQNYLEELKGQGIYDRDMENIAKGMEKTETELVNKILNQETINRQEQILTKLLKSEKAELEREKEKKRKSIESKTQKISNPLEYLEYKRKREKETELFKTVPAKLKPFYRDVISKYFYKFQRLEKENEKGN